MAVYDPQLPPEEPQSEPVDIVEPQRRVRHITSIQVRNLTPFPARDTLATALQQPAERPQFNELGGLSDDLDLTVGRRRGRRVSTSSVSTLARLRGESAATVEEGDEAGSTGSGSPEARKRTVSRGSLQSAKSMKRSSLTASSPGSSPGSVRAIKGRPASVSKSTPGPSTSALPPKSIANLSPQSQSGLEEVVSSRLVETFVTLKMAPKPAPPLEPMSPPLSPTPGATPTSPRFAHKRGLSSASQASVRSRTGSSLVNGKTPETTASQRTPTSSRIQTSISENSTIKASKRAPSKTASSRFPPRAPSPSSPAVRVGSNDPNTPDYISPFHRPSTNPKFAVDAQTVGEFIEGANLSADRLHITLWGRAVSGWGSSHTKGKGKAKELVSNPTHPPDTTEEWKILSEWDVDLSQLAPLSDDVHPSQLPANTLLCTLSPPDQTYYLPPPSSLRSPTSSRAPSPSLSTGYNSDPETNTPVSKARKSRPKDFPIKRARTRGSRINGGKTATFQDLVKLATLEAAILDTRRTLGEVVRDCDELLEADDLSVLKRDINGREFSVRNLVEERENINDSSESLRARIDELRERLRERRDVLDVVREMHMEDLRDEVDQASLVEDERRSQALLVARMQPVRTTLISTLSFIFPIELLSPPDLLYNILSVPLPIPLGVSDPAPPLTLTSHSEVNEDSVATALGYAAQVVQLLAVYLGHMLVYPITCCGSRSLIKDPISAMMGPRMFPLYSKGVETYRFEYGVYLLNKDIELLMSDRNLRALDLRHTLPNLKNLLLTLTSGEQAKLSRLSESPFPTAFDKRDSLLTIPEMSLTPSLSEPSVLSDEPTEDSSTGVDTPKDTSTTTSVTITSASASFSSRAKPYLGFGISPLAGFLRARYPSSAPSVKTVTEESPDAETSADGADHPESSDAAATSSAAQEDDEDDDRRTVRGLHVDSEADSDAHAKKMNGGIFVNGVLNGNAQGTQTSETPATGVSAEKLDRSNSPPFSAVSVA